MATGITRRIDELGRIVIPKEIRQNLGIREGEKLAINLRDDNIILTKEAALFRYENLIAQIVKSLAEVTTDLILITDRDKVIKTTLSILTNNPITQFNSYIDERKSDSASEYRIVKFRDEEIKGYFTIEPIISTSDCFGLVIIVSLQGYKPENKMLAKLVAKIIGNKIDIA